MHTGGTAACCHGEEGAHSQVGGAAGLDLAALAMRDGATEQLQARVVSEDAIAVQRPRVVTGMRQRVRRRHGKRRRAAVFGTASGQRRDEAALGAAACWRAIRFRDVRGTPIRRRRREDRCQHLVLLLHMRFDRVWHDVIRCQQRMRRSRALTARRPRCCRRVALRLHLNGGRRLLGASAPLALGRTSQGFEIKVRAGK